MKTLLAVYLYPLNTLTAFIEDRAEWYHWVTITMAPAWVAFSPILLVPFTWRWLR